MNTQIIEQGSVGGGPPNGHQFNLIRLPDGKLVLHYEVDATAEEGSEEDIRIGDAQYPEDLDEAIRDYLGQYFFSDEYPEFSKWWVLRRPPTYPANPSQVAGQMPE